MTMIRNAPVHRVQGQWRAAALALVPMALATAGALFDEWSRLGFSTWRAACRAAGLTLASLLAFSLQLLPTALAGLLAGALVVFLVGALRRHRPGAAGMALAAHGGCLMGMTAGLPLCLLSLPLPLVLGVETLLTMAAAGGLFALLQSRAGAATRAGARSFILHRETGT
jgi:hypothetical protein